MSRYRDDSQDTAVTHSATWVRVKSIAEDTTRTLSTLLFGLLVLHTGSAVAADQVIDRATHAVVEHAVAADAVIDARHSTARVIESAHATDRLAGALHVLHAESATAADAVLDQVSAVTTEHAHIADAVLGTRRVHSLIAESVRASDHSNQAASVLVTEAATAAEQLHAHLHARVLVSDTALFGDDTTDTHQAIAPVLVEHATAQSEVIDHLRAAVLVTDRAVIEDTPLGAGAGGDTGQAWTANVDSWAVSRYAPYTFASLAVIDGVAYGMAADGVYALNGESEAISGSIRTGKMDVGQGGLVHPLAAYLEYELDGTAEMDVTTTQSGQAETYTYALPAEAANELTNGRFTFGRGLRGRHFSFALRMTGTHGYINDLSVNTAPTKRRV